VPVIAYNSASDIGELENWPFDNPESQYVILSGNPEASGRIDAGGPGHKTRTGIWRCTAGSFECTEQGDELMTILSGKCRLTDQNTGEVTELTVGDTLFIRDGTRMKWDVLEDVTKVFFGSKPSGF